MIPDGHTLEYVRVDEAVMRQHYFIGIQSAITIGAFHS